MEAQAQAAQSSWYDTALALFIRLARIEQILAFDDGCAARKPEVVGPLVYEVVRGVSEEHAARLRDTLREVLSGGTADRVRAMEEQGTLDPEAASAVERGGMLAMGLALLRSNDGERLPGADGMLMSDLVRGMARSRGGPAPTKTLDFLDRHRFKVGDVLDIAVAADRSAGELIRLSAIHASAPAGEA